MALGWGGRVGGAREQVSDRHLEGVLEGEGGLSLFSTGRGVMLIFTLFLPPVQIRCVLLRGAPATRVADPSRKVLRAQVVITLGLSPHALSLENHSPNPSSSLWGYRPIHVLLLTSEQSVAAMSRLGRLFSEGSSLTLVMEMVCVRSRTRGICPFVVEVIFGDEAALRREYEA